MLKYEVEGERNMPFELSQIIVVSTAEGIETDGENTWNLELTQNNDVYIHIGKNKDYRKTELIKNIEVNNFTIDEEPLKGKIVLYKPSNNEGKIYENKEEYILKDKLIYTGEEKNNLKELNIANQGGIIAFRYSNQELRNIPIRRTRNKT